MTPLLLLNEGEDVVMLNVVGALLLDAHLGSIDEDSTKVQLFGREGANQEQRRWKLVSAGADTHYLVNAASGRFLDAHTQTISQDGTIVQLYGTDLPAPRNREWRFVSAGDEGRVPAHDANRTQEIRPPGTAGRLGDEGSWTEAHRETDGFATVPTIMRAPHFYPDSAGSHRCLR